MLHRAYSSRKRLAKSRAPAATIARPSRTATPAGIPARGRPPSVGRTDAPAAAGAAGGSVSENGIEQTPCPKVGAPAPPGSVKAELRRQPPVIWLPLQGGGVREGCNGRAAEEGSRIDREPGRKTAGFHPSVG